MRLENMAAGDGHSPLSAAFGRGGRMVSRELFPLPEVAERSGRNSPCLEVAFRGSHRGEQFRGR